MNKNKIQVYYETINNEEKPTETFLQGLLFLEEFSFFYELLKMIDEEIEIIPTFEYRENIEENDTMKSFSVKILSSTKMMDEIVEYISECINDGRFQYECEYEGDIVHIRLH